MSAEIPRETHAGILRLGKWDGIVCAHLDNGIRVITQRSFMDMLDMRGRGKLGHRIARLIDHPQLKGLEAKDLSLDIRNPVHYHTKIGPMALGYEAGLLISFCKALLKAREFGLIGTYAEMRYAQAAV